MEKLSFEDKKIAVLGLGIEGIALVDFLISTNAKLTVLDKFSESELLENNVDPQKIKSIIADEKIEKVFGEHYLDNLERFDIIFRSPGLTYLNPQIQEAKSKGVIISSQIKLFFDLCPCQIIGVTGTKGKGTTASLISEILKKKFQNPNDKLQIKSQNLNKTNTNDVIPDLIRDLGLDSRRSLPRTLIRGGNDNVNISDLKQKVFLAGNIGYPAITLIPNLNPKDIVILELSSFQLMDLEKSPHIAVVTNLTVDHLDYHKNIEEYRESKINIIKYQNESDFAVLNFDSTFEEAELKNIKSSIKYFGGKKGLDSRRSLPRTLIRGGNDDVENRNENLDAFIENKNNEASVILKIDDEKIEICKESEIQLFGRHNLENIAAATLAADILNVDVKIIQKTVKEFKGLPHRLEFVREIDGVKYINDSFATNPDPTMAAIHSFSEPKVLILGGSGKGADFSELAGEIIKNNVSSVILIGDEAKSIESKLLEKNFSGWIVFGGKTMKQIVKKARDAAKPSEVVILSPACASFGLFKNYKDRGEQFRDEVLILKS